MKDSNTDNSKGNKHGALTRDNNDYLNSNRHFTPEGYKNIHHLMDRIGKGDLSARDTFLKAIQPFVDRSATRIAGQVYGEKVDAERVKEVTQDVLMELIHKPKYFQGGARGWGNLGQHIQSSLRSKLANDKEHAEQEYNMKVLLSADSIIASDKGDPQQALSAEQLRATSERIINSLISNREAQVLKLRLGIDTGEGHALETVAKMCGVSRARISQIENRAYKKLRESPKATAQLSPHLEDYIPPVASSQQEAPMQNYWQAHAGSAQPYRASIRSLFKQPDGTQYNDSQLRAASGLSDMQWNALMKADLARDPKSCEILRSQGSTIAKKLFVALEETISKLPRMTDQKAYSRFIDSVAGIMKIAQHDESISPQQR